MLTLQQLRCFIATYEEGSLTAAAERLGYAQPSVSEQIRNLERTLGAPLFRRVGRGVVATTIADDFRAHAEKTLAAAEEARAAVASQLRLESGTVRFGMFGISRLYAGAELIADVLDRHPGLRVELIGTNSTEVQEDLRRGRALPVGVLDHEAVALQVGDEARDRRAREPGHTRDLGTARRTPLAQGLDHAQTVQFAQRLKRPGPHSGRHPLAPRPLLSRLRTNSGVRRGVNVQALDETTGSSCSSSITGRNRSPCSATRAST